MEEFTIIIVRDVLWKYFMIDFSQMQLSVITAAWELRIFKE